MVKTKKNPIRQEIYLNLYHTKNQQIKHQYHYLYTQKFRASIRKTRFSIQIFQYII